MRKYNSLYSKCHSISKNLRDIFSTLSLYEDDIKSVVGVNLVDDLLIETKRLYFRYKELDELFFSEDL